MRAGSPARRVAAIRVAIAATVVALWETASLSGLFYRDVIPSLIAIGRALGVLSINPDFYRHLAVSLMEVGQALAIGGGLGIVIGLALGGSRFLAHAFEPYLYYLGPTPKIIFFPIMIMWFGVGPASKVALGALSCFFPIVLSVAAGMRQIDPVLIRVGRSFHANALQMALKIHLPRCGRRSSTGYASASASPSSARCWPKPSSPTPVSATSSCRPTRYSTCRACTPC